MKTNKWMRVTLFLPLLNLAVGACADQASDPVAEQEIAEEQSQPTLDGCSDVAPEKEGDGEATGDASGEPAKEGDGEPSGSETTSPEDKEEGAPAEEPDPCPGDEDTQTQPDKEG